MNYTKGLIIFTAIALGAALVLGGGFISIMNIVEPRGLLFEGIIGFSVDVLILMLVVVATSVGKAILTFSDVFQKQVEIQQDMQQHVEENAARQSGFPQGFPLNDMFPGMTGNMQIIDLKTGEKKDVEIGDGEDFVGKISEILKNSIKVNDSGKDKTIEQLEAELAVAIQNDDFEAAKNISKAIEDKKNEGDKK